MGTETSEEVLVERKQKPTRESTAVSVEGQILEGGLWWGEHTGNIRAIPFGDQQ